MSKAKIQRRTIPFINPLRCIHALTISPGIVRAARPIEHVGRVRSNGVGHQALFKTGENWIRIEVLIWKCLVLFLKAFVCIFFSCPPPSVGGQPGGHVWAVYRTRSLFLSYVDARRRMYQILSAAEYIYEEARESYIWQSATNKV